MSPRSNSTFRCSICQATTLRWQGRCGECGEWGTIEEVSIPSITLNSGSNTYHSPVALTPSTPATPITQVNAYSAQAVPTQIGEVDRVLGGGIVPGAVILLAGEPGVGKSTLLLEICAHAARAGQSQNTRVLYISAEESASQIRLRAERIGAVDPHLFLAAETEIPQILGHIEALRPSLLVIDSVQTVFDPQMNGTAGGTTQVKTVTSTLVRVAKSLNLPVILVGHVTKDGNVAGPRVLEHLVDVVCQFEGDRHSRLRLLRAVKNRFGPVDELGCFDMDESGIKGLHDPSGIFLAANSLTEAGTCVSISLDGRRAMPIQVQSLVVRSALPSPRRSNVGIDSSRLSMILAVAQSRLGFDLSTQDVYVSTVGGAKSSEPALDLAIGLAVISAFTGAKWPLPTVAIAEVSLVSELRSVTGIQKRLNECARLGFKRAIVPASAQVDSVPGLEICPVANLAQAIDFLQPTN